MTVFYDALPLLFCSIYILYYFYNSVILVTIILIVFQISPVENSMQWHVCRLKNLKEIASVEFMLVATAYGVLVDN